MEIIRTINDMRQVLDVARKAGRRIGLVPTMGALHEGHLSLISAISDECDCVVLTVFVNPLQFGPSEDFDRYPRNPELDSKMAEDMDVDYLFMPETAELYPQKNKTTVSVAGLQDHLCGKTRPGHFDGVTTVVAKLFNIIQPHVAAFGEKDRQQLTIIRRMVADLNFPIQILAVPTVRETDGLAISSRNTYLTAHQREDAVGIVEALEHMKGMIDTGEIHSHLVIQSAVNLLKNRETAQVDYISVADTETLDPVDTLVPGTDVILAAAVFFGNTRLIDNRIVRVPRFE